jgi:hypothetical protein
MLSIITCPIFVRIMNDEIIFSRHITNNIICCQTVNMWLLCIEIMVFSNFLIHACMVFANLTYLDSLNRSYCLMLLKGFIGLSEKMLVFTKPFVISRFFALELELNSNNILLLSRRYEQRCCIHYYHSHYKSCN